MTPTAAEFVQGFDQLNAVDQRLALRATDDPSPPVRDKSMSASGTTSTIRYAGSPPE
jgi:hypothetical protein